MPAPRRQRAGYLFWYPALCFKENREGEKKKKQSHLHAHHSSRVLSNVNPLEKWFTNNSQPVQNFRRIDQGGRADGTARRGEYYLLPPAGSLRQARISPGKFLGNLAELLLLQQTACRGFVIIKL